MEIRKKEIVLYALSELSEIERHNVSYTKEQLARALDIEVKTLDLYLSRLSNEGWIKRSKKHYKEDLRDSFEITGRGRRELDRIRESIGKKHLTPERHKVPSMVPVKLILARIRNPLEKIFFLSLFSRLKRFDFPFYLETIKTSKAENNINKLINEMESGLPDSEGPLVDTFFRTCFYGMSNISGFLENETDQNTETYLIMAEVSFRQGRYGDAKSIYEHLLSGKVPITPAQWTIASINLAFINFKEGYPEKAIEEMDSIIETIDNKILKAYTTQMKARVYSATGQNEKALKLYTSAVNSFKTFGLPLLLAITYINKGIVYFRMEDYRKAEQDWLKGKKIARRINTPFVEGVASINLSSIERIRGNYERGLKYLNTFKDFFKLLGDYESQAYLDYNYALVYMDMKEKKKALEHFGLSETIAYPSPSPQEREERRRMFLDCANKNGFDDIDVPSISSHEKWLENI